MIEEFLGQKIQEALLKLYRIEEGQHEISLQKTRKDFEGDFTFVVFPLLRYSRRSAEATANEIGEYLKKHSTEIESFNVINGFLNISIADQIWKEQLTAHFNDQDYGITRIKDIPPHVIEYSSPNTNKPLHLGHIRNNLLGYAVSNILKANGYPVVKVNLVNDRGIHICKTMLAYTKWGKGETPSSSGLKGDHLVGKYYVLFEKKYKEEIEALLNKGFSEEDAKNKAPLIVEAQEMLRKWEAKDKATRDLWEKLNEWVYEGFDITYKNLGVDFDKIYYESDTYLEGKNIISEALEDGKLIRKDDGSVWADLSTYKIDNKLLLRSDGTSVYMTQDIGTAQLRFDEYRPLKLIYVVGNEQDHHFTVLQKILLQFGKEWAGNIHHLSYGMVELPEGKMKSREGKVVDADELIESMIKEASIISKELGKSDPSSYESEDLYRMIALAALKYFILKVDPRKNMLFNPKESIDFNGNTGPFIQYTYARIQSLFRKSNTEITTSGKLKSQNISMLPKEKKILKLLYDYPSVIKEAGKEFSPAIIANYVYELAKEFNQYYQETPILKAENNDLVLFRLMLSRFTANVIKSAFHLLGIDVPERM